MYDVGDKNSNKEKSSGRDEMSVHQSGFCQCSIIIVLSKINFILYSKVVFIQILLLTGTVCFCIICLHVDGNMGLHNYICNVVIIVPHTLSFYNFNPLCWVCSWTTLATIFYSVKIKYFNIHRYIICIHMFVCSFSLFTLILLYYYVSMHALDYVTHFDG